MNCVSCHAVVPEDALFCPRCGARRAAAGDAAPTDPILEALRKALGQQYVIQRLLGKGGMGAVYLATETALERDVAIKVLPPDRGSTQESRDRFRREARTAARLSHPNIVPLHTFGDVDGVLFFVMGYVRGESLAARLKREGRIPDEDARRILLEIADALDYAHGLGIIHRDIKPDNVLLEGDSGRAMLMDFGVAKALGAGQTMTEAGSVLGTPHYMSPEQAQGKADIDSRSDLYSLGVMGYRMLSGQLPFEAATPGEVMAQHITREPPALTSMAPDTPNEIASALTRCLAKDPKERWPDASALRQALTAADSDEQPAAFDGLGAFLIEPLVAAYVLLCTATWWLGGGDVADPFPLLPMAALLGIGLPALLLLFRWHHLRRLGFGSAQIRSALCAPLRKWIGWLPKGLRSRNDVWERLPTELRHFRLAFGGMILFVFLGLVPVVILNAALRSSVLRTGRAPFTISEKGYDKLTIGLMFPVALAMIGFGARWELARRRLGLDPYLGNRMIETSTSRLSFWSKPEVAVHLMPARSAGSARNRARESPDELVSIITRMASRLTGPSRDAGERARQAARQLQETIASLDAEIVALSSGADAAEAERLATKLASLGPASPDEPEPKRQVRGLFESQLAMLKGFASRLDAINARRGQEVDRLRALCRHAEELSSARTDSGGISRATERIDALCAEVDPSFTESPTIERAP